MKAFLIAIVILFGVTCGIHARTIDQQTLDRWAAPYRNWHYRPDHVIPAQLKIPGYEQFHNTDVPCVYKMFYLYYCACGNKGRGIALITSRPVQSSALAEETAVDP